jgi:hypothetical protein
LGHETMGVLCWCRMRCYHFFGEVHGANGLKSSEKILVYSRLGTKVGNGYGRRSAEVPGGGTRLEKGPKQRGTSVDGSWY